MKYILIVEEHSVVRLATKFILNELIGPVTLLEAFDFTETMSLVNQHNFDLILLDIELPVKDGITMIHGIRQVNAKVRILVFSSLDEALYALHYIKEGANGFLSKNTSIAEFKAAILSVMETGRYISKEMQGVFSVENAGTGIRSNPLETLSHREVEVMNLLLEGLWTKEIATRLKITVSSVSTYKSRIFEKLEVATLIDLYTKVEFLRNNR